MKNIFLSIFSVFFLLSVNSCNPDSKGKVMDEGGVLLDDLEGFQSNPGAYPTYFTSENSLFSGKAYSLHENGKVNEEITLNYGKRNGTSTGYSKYGQLIFKHNFRENKKNGISETYYLNGKPRLMCNYLNGQLDGFYNFNYDNGAICLAAEYRLGKASSMVSYTLEGDINYYTEKRENNSRKISAIDAKNILIQRFQYYDFGQVLKGKKTFSDVMEMKTYKFLSENTETGLQCIWSVTEYESGYNRAFISCDCGDDYAIKNIDWDALVL